MDFSEILEKRRTIRFFKQQQVSKKEIISLINAARLSPCAMNKQVLRYAAVNKKSMLKNIFDGTLWAAKVKPHRTPVWGETAPNWFIAVYGPCEHEASYVKFDVGSAVMSMEFQAQNSGLGCAWLGSFDKTEVKKMLKLADDCEVYALVAVGYPAESPKYENITSNEDQSYYLNEENTLVVPKYTVEVLTEFYED